MGSVVGAGGGAAVQGGVSPAGVAASLGFWRGDAGGFWVSSYRSVVLGAGAWASGECGGGGGGGGCGDAAFGAEGALPLSGARGAAGGASDVVSSGEAAGGV